MASPVGAYTESCGEFFGIVKNPLAFYGGGCGALMGCKQPDTMKAYQTWSAIIFLTGIFANLATLILSLAFGGDMSYLVNYIINWLIGTIYAYFWAHLCWFIMVKQNGCCGPIAFAIVGVLDILIGVLMIVGALMSAAGTYGISLITTLPYGIAYTYAGVNLLQTYQAGGGAVAPSSPPPPEEPKKEVELETGVAAK